mgnify:CR=1 FL=1
MKSVLLPEKSRRAAFYDQAFEGNPYLLIPTREKQSSHVFHQYTLRLVNTDRDALRAALIEKGIPAMIYYPIPLHMQKAYNDPRYKKGDFPIAEKLAKCVPESSSFTRTPAAVRRSLSAFAKTNNLITPKQKNKTKANRIY